MKFSLLLTFIFCLFAVGARGAESGVTLSESSESFTLDNGIVRARVNKATGDLVSLVYQGKELLADGSGHPGGYWSHTPGHGMRAVDRVTMDPRLNGGARAEVSIKGTYNGGTFRFGGVAADIEVRYTLGRGESGIYTYSIFNHPARYPATSVGEARFAAKLNSDVFDYLGVDERRNKVMARPVDWDNGTELNFKEARRLNTGIYAGQVEHKYDYCAIQFDTPAFGWGSTRDRIGIWFINPSTEYLSGGATKEELTGHLDCNDGGAPTLLNYWRGSHYGGSYCTIDSGETWTKVVGPFMIYCNSGMPPEQLWREALQQAEKEKAAWPYDWVAGVDYPQSFQRGEVGGRVVVHDPQAPGLEISNLLVGLAKPDYPARGWRGGSARTVDWQLDAKYYEFWTRGDSATGKFHLNNVRPGVYTLHAIADGVLGEFTATNIVVRPGRNLDLGRLDWRPVRYGRQLWEIGVPNRSAEEFFHGDHYWKWGLYLQYPKEFPQDVDFVIGQSDWSRDWNYAQVPRDNGKPTVWTVEFTLPEAPHGKAVLRLAIAGTSVRGGIEVSVNDHPAGGTGPMQDTATVRRDAIRGYWSEYDVVFDAALMQAGLNQLKLSIPDDYPTAGVEYDYLRLELDSSGTLVAMKPK